MATSRCYIAPIRSSTTAYTVMHYDTTAKEVVAFTSSKRFKKNIIEHFEIEFRPQTGKEREAETENNTRLWRRNNQWNFKLFELMIMNKILILFEYV